ncbi:hypothetical protein [Marivita sp. GX14005]|uniref:hypothetical protein n=1 Tax=Marivita sp. GX14005 TaxID=2942276 RepID=UPI002019CA15|nr:hypothetical protein [Marivita sp. GX14005]MCL3883215.1 hypothetical protein [Marivita sp. GX14005]
MSDVEAILDARAEDLRAIDDMILGDAAGVAQASDHLREALDAIRPALDERQFEAAATFGYGDISSGSAVRAR